MHTITLLRRYGFLALLMLPLAFVACDDDDGDGLIRDADEKGVAEVIDDTDKYDELRDLLNEAGLVNTLDDKSQTFTVFAPNNAAVEAAQSTIDGLSDDARRNILLYHVLGGNALKAADLSAPLAIYTNGYQGPNGEVPLFVRNNGTSVLVNNATVIATDQEAENGVIHEVNAVILPPNVVEIAQYVPMTSDLVAAIGRADGDLADVLSGDGPFTVFAPDNNAFMNTADEDLTSAQLASVLTYHVVAGNILSTDLTDGETTNATTVQGETIAITRSGDNVSIVDANGNTFNVTTANVQGTNGVVHVIDGVMLPDNI